MQPRSKDWWNFVTSCSNDDSNWWHNNLRMSKSTFNYICCQLSPYIQKQNTQMRECVPVEQRVALTLWRLATNADYRSISQLFGLGRSTVCEIFHECCSVIAEKLLPRFVQIPTGEELKEIIEGFESTWGFPQVVGAIDGSHIPITRPVHNQADYYNRKGFHSIIIQAVVDYRYMFIDICVGWPGRVHDARVLGNSRLYLKATNGTLFPNWSRRISRVDVPLLLLGDPAYPLMSWLMKPFPHSTYLPRQQKKFNQQLSRARVVVENAFGRLKGRWRCLLKKNESNTMNMPKIISCCVVLHNICEMFGEECPDEWIVPEPPSTDSSTDSTSSHTASSGTEIREALVCYFNH